MLYLQYKVESMYQTKALETVRPLLVQLGLHSKNLNVPKNEFSKSFGAYYWIYFDDCVEHYVCVYEFIRFRGNFGAIADYSGRCINAWNVHQFGLE